jgi:hypothetical protein
MQNHHLNLIDSQLEIIYASFCQAFSTPNYGSVPTMYGPIDPALRSILTSIHMRLATMDHTIEEYIDAHVCIACKQPFSRESLHRYANSQFDISGECYHWFCSPCLESYYRHKEHKCPSCDGDIEDLVNRFPNGDHQVTIEYVISPIESLSGQVPPD